MKYLPLKQSHLKANGKYYYLDHIANCRKYEFIKDVQFNFYPNMLPPLFIKYLHNDITIHW